MFKILKRKATRGGDVHIAKICKWEVPDCAGRIAFEEELAGRLICELWLDFVPAVVLQVQVPGILASAGVRHDATKHRDVSIVAVKFGASCFLKKVKATVAEHLIELEAGTLMLGGTKLLRWLVLRHLEGAARTQFRTI